MFLYINKSICLKKISRQLQQIRKKKRPILKCSVMSKVLALVCGKVLFVITLNKPFKKINNLYSK